MKKNLLLLISSAALLTSCGGGTSTSSTPAGTSGTPATSSATSSVTSAAASEAKPAEESKAAGTSEAEPEESSEAGPEESSEAGPVVSDRELAAGRLLRVGQNMATKKAYGADINLYAGVNGHLVLDSIGDNELLEPDVYDESAAVSLGARMNSALVEEEENTFVETSVDGRIAAFADIAEPYVSFGENPEDFKYEKISATLDTFDCDFGAYLRGDELYLDASDLGDGYNSVMKFIQDLRPSEQEDDGERRLENEGSEPAPATPFGDFLGFYLKDETVSNTIGTLPGLLGMGLSMGSSYLLPAGEGETPVIPEFVWDYINIDYDPTGDLAFTVRVNNQNLPSLFSNVWDLIPHGEEEEEVVDGEVESNDEPSQEDYILGIINSFLDVVDFEVGLYITFGQDTLKSIGLKCTINVKNGFADVFNSFMKQRDDILSFNFSSIEGHVTIQASADFFYGDEVSVNRPEDLEKYRFLNNRVEEKEEEEGEEIY